ncbi:MAG TPA: hypothetical protein VGM81_25230 [Burkholderiaceae bacterium]|jgi:hypothetical protein
MKPSENESKLEGSAQATPPVAGSVVPSGSRRRLLRGGLAAAPALLALKTTPVMACNCKVPSGFSTSGNLSHNQGKTCAAPGTKPSGWKNNCGSQNPYYYNGCGTAAKRGDMFKTCFTNSTSYTNHNFDTCLGRGDADDQALAVACYLQAITSGGGNFPTTQQVKDIWNLGVCGSGYRPNNQSTYWSKAQCLSYFKYLTGQ